MKKILSIVLALAVVVSCFSILAIATGGTQETLKAAKYTEIDPTTSRSTYICGWQPNRLWTAEQITDDLDGTFTFSYTIYNVGTEAMKAQLKFNTVGYTPNSVPSGQGPKSSAMPNAQTSTVTIEPGKSEVLEISITANNGWTTFTIANGTAYSMPLNYVTIRLDLPVISGNDAARSFVIVNNGFTYGDYFVDQFETSTKWTKVAATEADLPETYVAAKFTSNADQPATGYDHAYYGGSPFAADASFNGTKTLNYDIYNTSDKQVKVTMYILGLVGSSANSGDGTTKAVVTLAPGEKGNITTSVAVENGIAKVKSDGTVDVALNLIRIRFNVLFTDGAEGDSIAIASTDSVASDYILDKHTSSKFDKTLLTALPEVVSPSTSPETSPETSTEPKAAGFKYTVTEAITSSTHYGTSEDVNYYENDATFNGKKSVTYRFYNISEHDVTAKIAFTVNDSGWHSVNPASKVITAGSYADITASIDIVNGKGTINGKEYDLSKLTIRFDYIFTGEAVGDSLIVTSADENDPIFTSARGMNKMSKEVVYELPEIEAPKIPTGVTLTTSEEVDGSGKLYFVTTTGLVTDADVEDGVAVKTFKVKNNGEAAIEVKLDLQALVGGSWKSPSGSTAQFFTIDPGQTVEVSCEVDCENGKVTIAEEEVAISKLFGKFSIAGEDGTLPKGSSFTIYFAEAEATCFANLINSKNTAHEYWTQETIYTAVAAGTGDVLPVALIATVAFALVALVVVSKKRRED